MTNHAHSIALTAVSRALPQPTFDDYAKSGFGDDLVSVMPADAVINPNNPKADQLFDKRGKIPGFRRPAGWSGFGDWNAFVPTARHYAEWQSWGSSIGLKGKRFPAIDIDVDDADLAAAIHDEAIATFGPAPARFGRGSRRILAYAGEGFGKRRLAFRQPDANALPNPPKPQAVELLGDGQQYVVRGVHPSTGQPYWWKDGVSLNKVGAGNLTPIKPDQADLFYARVEELLRLKGYDIVEKAQSSADAAVVDQVSLRAPDIDAVRRAVVSLTNDVGRLEWIRLGAAIKASAGPANELEAAEIWQDFSGQWGENTPEYADDTWQSLSAPFKVGWIFLSDFATHHGDGSFNSAAEEFDAIPGATPPTDAEREAMRLATNPLAALQQRYVWVENRKLVFDLKTSVLLDKEQLNVRHSDVGPITAPSKSAWGQLLQDKYKLQAVAGSTYRPGRGLYVHENLPDLVGKCINNWRPSSLVMPTSVGDADVERWLELVAVVVPDPAERKVVIDWLAWFAQNPDQKPHWALVIGSSAEGIGKDLMLQPFRALIGQHNVQEVRPEDLSSQFNDYLQNCRLIIVQEMDMSDKQSVMNRLKPLIAAPPNYLRINIKNVRVFVVPNVVGMIFLTNMENALALSSRGRRYFVTWNRDDPQPEEYYAALSSWYAAGGLGAVGRWLLQRNVTGFSAQGQAPATAAREDMRLAARPVVEAVIADALAERSGPFAHRFFTLDEVFEFIAPYGRTNGRSLSPRALSGRLQAAGALKFDRRVTLGWPGHMYRQPRGYTEDACQIFVHNSDTDGLALTNNIHELRKAFWLDRQLCEFDATGGELDD